MALVNFSNVDFDQIKTSIMAYLKANSNFTDYDFEGSNLSTIIDTLAYNTYINSYNANMVSNEVFIDSATLRENIVSLARNIGYLPRSRKASSANVSFNVDVSTGTSVSLTLKAGIALMAAESADRVVYTFAIPEDITVPVDTTGNATFSNIKVYEGTRITQAFQVNSRTPNQRYILTNPGIDTDLLSVIVKESKSSTVTRKYTQFNNLFDVKSNSAVYFLKETEGERYELLFGDGVFGQKLEEPNYVEVSYITSSGAASNGFSDFSFSGILLDNNGTSITTGISAVVTLSHIQI